MKIKYISWRDGRPRFNPGTVARGLGFQGRDLRRDGGEWFNADEAREFSRDIGIRIAERREEYRQSGRRPSIDLKSPKLTNARGYVYFLRSAERIKIGFSKTPWTRAGALLTGLSHGIDCIVIVPGTERDERRMHRYLDNYRQGGEWFDVHPKVLEAMHRSLTFRKVTCDDDDAVTDARGRR